MLQTPALFFDAIRDKSVAFVGIGVTNTELIKLFARQGVRTIAADQRTEQEIDRNLLQDFRDLGVRVQLGEGYLNNLDVDVLFRTPGMYYYEPELRTLRREGVVVTSELEVFFDLCPCPIIAITGSDGKSTTSTLIAEFLRQQGRTVHLGGNLGVALLPKIFEMKREDIAVVELSSFQLISMRTSPQRAVITNVTPNHLDIHGTMEEYIDAKQNIYRHQNAFSHTVLNVDNEITDSFASEVRGRLSQFSLTKPVYNGAYLAENGILTMVNYGVETPLFHRNAIRIPGTHNVANYLAAMSAVSGLVDYSTMEAVARSFAGVEHRLEFVREKDGIRWYNDCIATSPTRVIAGLKALDDNIVLIAGGYDKQLPYAALLPSLFEHVKLLLLTGPAGERFEREVKAAPQYGASGLKIIRLDTVEDAVLYADKHAQRGDVVTLSPANSSFDAYPNFEAKGRHYKELVTAL